MMPSGRPAGLAREAGRRGGPAGGPELRPHGRPGAGSHRRRLLRAVRRLRGRDGQAPDRPELRPPSTHALPAAGESGGRARLLTGRTPACAGPLSSTEEQLVSLPPLVEPAEDLSIEEVRRYSRHLIIPDVGMDGQKRLKNAKVLAVGAGGLGSPVLMYLAAAGVGTLGIVEFDVVDESNLQRQIIHGQSDVGRSKAESARDSIKEINPLVDVRLHETRLDSDNVLEIFGEYDLIVDGTEIGRAS